MFDKLYRHIMLLFLIVLIPAMLLGVYSYTHAVQTALKNAQQTLDRQMAFAVQEIDKRLENVSGMHQLVVNNNDAMSLTLQEAPDAAEVRRMQNVCSLLSKMSLLNDSLSEVVLYTGSSKVVAASGIYPADYYFQEYFSFKGYSLEDWNRLLNERITMRTLPVVTLTQKTIDRYTKSRVVPIVTTFGMGSGRGLLLFTINAQSLVDVLSKYIPYTNTGFSVSTAAGDTLISSSQTPSAGSVLMCTYPSAQNGWRYTAYVSQDEITLTSRQMLTQVLIIIISVLGFGLLLALMVSRWMYQPLSNIQSMLAQADDEVAEQLGSLEKLEAQVSRLMETSSSGKEQFSVLARSYAESAFLAQTMSEKKAALLENIMTRGLGFHGGPYQCAAVRFCDENPQNESMAHQVLEKFFPVCALGYNGTTSLYVFEIGAAYTRPVIENALRQLFAHMPGRIVAIAVGNEINHVQKMYKALNASLTVLQHIPQDSRDELLFSDDFDIANQYVFTYRDEWQLIEALQRGEGEVLHPMLDGILLKNYEKRVSHSQMQHLFDELRSTATRYAQQEGISLPPRSMEKAPSFDATRLEIHQLYDLCMADTDARTRNVHAQLARNADAYIQEHYVEDIYLESIAGELGVSAKHLSRVYKQQNDMNISDQISLLRIEHAKQLLASSGETISTIMGKTGFVNRATFLRSFKKYVGISPSAFRQIHNPAGVGTEEENEEIE